jgi:hypothetical protein
MIDRIPNSEQLYFFLMPEETSQLIEYINKKGGSIYLPRSTIAEPHECEIFANLSRIYFCPRQVRGQISMIRIAEDVYSIDSTVSPVIEFQCSVMRKAELSRGRMYFRGGYIGRDGWFAFPETLYELFKTVSLFIKKSFLSKERRYGAYISKGSQKYLSDGGKLVQF